MIKIYFFDGDGTLWYPKTTQHNEKPYLVYEDPNYRPERFSEFFELTPGAKDTLQRLHDTGAMLVLVSTHHTDDAAEATSDKIFKARALGIDGLFDQILSAPNRHEGKAEVITQVLEAEGCAPADALMVGDLYNWDYAPAQSIGVPARLLRTPYQEEYAREHSVPDGDFIDSLEDLL